jgi:EAL domain-containing protein (putative c-di-GMP-specific phosphodiesterase class I)
MCAAQRHLSVRSGAFSRPAAKVPFSQKPLSSPSGRSPISSECGQAIHAARRRVCAFVFIVNLPCLAEVYGVDFAMLASLEIRRRIQAMFVATTANDLTCLREDCFLLWSNASFMAENLVPGSADAERLEELLTSLSTEPIRVAGVCALIQLHADWLNVRSPDELGASEIDLALWTAQPFPDFQEDRSDGWRQRYRSDMEVAVRVSEALQAHRLALTWQPVANTCGAVTTLYLASCVGMLTERGYSTSLGADIFIPCFQRLGLLRMFDRAMAQKVLTALERTPSAHLGLSISIHSAKVGPWWASLMAALRRDPKLARRLVVEISGGTAFCDLESVRYFCEQLRGAGCRIAFKDFGVGEDNLASIHACRPDIVKLDSGFIRRARNSVFARECLEEMVSLCGRLATHVVVNGIEREEDIQVSLSAGAGWIQGYYLNSNARQMQHDAHGYFLESTR